MIKNVHHLSTINLLNPFQSAYPPEYSTETDLLKMVNGLLPSFLPSHARSRTLTHAHARSRTLTHAHARSRTLTHAHARSRTLTHAHARSRTLTHAHARSRTLTHAHARSRTHVRTHTRTHAQAHAHSQARTNFGIVMVTYYALKWTTVVPALGDPVMSGHLACTATLSKSRHISTLNYLRSADTWLT